MDVLAHELNRVTDHWVTVLDATDTLESQIPGGGPQLFLVADEEMVAWAAWAAAVFRSVSKAQVWAGSSQDLLQLAGPPVVAEGEQVVIFLSRPGGGISEIRALDCLQNWYTSLKAFSLSDVSGALAEKISSPLIFHRTEISLYPSLFPTRYQIALMNLIGKVSGKTALSKRATMLSEWYVPPSPQAIKIMTKEHARPLALWTGAKAATLSFPLLQVIQRFNVSCRQLVGPSGLEKIDEKELLVAVTSRTTETEETSWLEKIRDANLPSIIFASESAKVIPDVALSSKCTDIGRSIHSMLSVQKLMACRTLAEQASKAGIGALGTNLERLSAGV